MTQYILYLQNIQNKTCFEFHKNTKFGIFRLSQGLILKCLGNGSFDIVHFSKRMVIYIWKVYIHKIGHSHIIFIRQGETLWPFFCHFRFRFLFLFRIRFKVLYSSFGSVPVRPMIRFRSITTRERKRRRKKCCLLFASRALNIFNVSKSLLSH